MSGSFIRSDRKSLIIKQEWGGGGGQADVADDRGSRLCVIESHLRRLKIAKEQDVLGFDTFGFLFSSRFKEIRTVYSPPRSSEVNVQLAD